MLKYDASLCTGCRICEQACMQAHYHGDESDMSRIKITSIWPAEEAAAVCRQCPKPHCVEACPTGAIEQVDGIIKIDPEKCTQCYECFAACPFQARVLDRAGYPAFCDTCDGQYQCVQFCPTKALKVGGHTSKSGVIFGGGMSPLKRGARS
ncbi:MAG: 4Fe-4S dicluster domain-containing protein [Desulfitobacteriaceae bacterium]|nr:4Fe-4S dicluster domain-containing protein [Desulfitobacteriaceae bacterium]MDI6877859.1 4Fe-4S dicluster domain-containing protein [Desulfitobacteriaceae bacterium]MDI6912740.1 4Fe-4S dicluster domain-containing protein [Desulfitobacteriaceae bacterium]